MKSLRPQRARKFAAKFCENGFNASKAVRDLGITSNPKSAWVIGHRLLSNVVTLKAVEEHLKKSKMSADEVLETLTEVAKTETKISGSEKLKALELLGKGHKLFTDKVETSQNPIDSLDSAQSLYAQKYQELTKCSESEAKLAAESAFSFTQTIDHSEKQAS